MTESQHDGASSPAAGSKPLVGVSPGPVGARLRLSARKKMLFWLLTTAVLLAVFFAAAEVVARAKGYEPYHLGDAKITVEPGGRFYTARPTGGYGQLPGHFKVTLHDGFSFEVTHNSDGLRVTQSSDTHAREGRQAIWIMGCSFTHGWSLNDEETYPWLVQQALPDYEVVNGGIEGHGTLQSRMEFQDMLTRKAKPAVVILAYGTFHDFRNTFLRLRQKSIAPFNKLGPLTQPYARFTDSGDLDYFMAPVVYREFPFMRYSAFIHFLEERYNMFEVRAAKSHLVSAELIKRFALFCESEQIKFVLAGISSDCGPMLEYCSAQGIATVDISVVLALPGNTNAPHDNHPSASANRVYAERLTAYLTRHVLSSGTNQPTVAALAPMTNDQ